MRPFRFRRPYAAGTLVASVLIASPLALAAPGEVLRQGTRNGTTAKETEIIGGISAQSGKGGFVTRQSNISEGAKAGGAAIYGCRTPTGGTAQGTAPCLRASNLATGSAFEFSSKGAVGGLISLGDPSKANPGRPFVTNAVGVATGLNADKVDGKDAADLVGASGPTGPAGQAGPAGPLSIKYLTGDPVTLPAGAGVTGTVPCPSGMSVIGGGATILTLGPDVIMDSSYPSDNASDADLIRDNAWSVAYNNPTASGSSFRVYAICTTATSTS